MRKAKIDAPLMGKWCGYTKLPNGNIKVAPLYCDQLREISGDIAAVQATAFAFAKALRDLAKPVEAVKQKLFDRLAEDYGIDLDKVECMLNFSTGELSMTPKKKES